MKLQYETIYLFLHNLPFPYKEEDKDKYEELSRGVVEASGWNADDFNRRMVLRVGELN